MPFADTSEQNHSQRDTIFLALALALAIAFRIYLLIVNDFPVNDGGLFLQFVRETAATFPNLPEDITFNGLALPFAYPPLSFWLGALLTRLGFDSLEVVRVMPILSNLLYVLLFALLLIRSGRSRIFVGLAILFMAVTLRSYEWLLMGGGMSRGLGAVFLVLALLAITVPDQGRREEVTARRSALAGVAVAGAILSHLEWGILAAASVVLSRALGSVTMKRFAFETAVAGAAALALVVPWLMFIQASHGLEPMMSALSTSGWSPKAPAVRLIEFTVVAGLTNPLVFLGGLVLLVRRQWFWIGFLLIAAILTPRHAVTPQMLAMAVFAAQGFLSLYDFAVRFLRSRQLVSVGAAALLVALLIHGSYRAYQGSDHSFRALPQESRDAMAWVSQHRSGKRFAIVTDRPWQSDSSAEWFPVLASAVSVTTVQGREWNGEYLRWYHLSEALRKSGSCPELQNNLTQFGSYRLVWVETMQHCFAGHRVVFRNRAVTIYEGRSSYAQRSGEEG